MSKLILIIGFIACSALILSAQKTEDISRLKIRISAWPGSSTKNQLKKSGYVNAELSYRMNAFVEAGLSTGVFQGIKFQSDDDGNITSKKHYLLYFGPHANLHIMPFIIDNSKLRFDFYLAGKAGWKPYYPYNEKLKLSTFYFLGAGTSYFITKNIGLFAEYGYYKAGNLIVNENENSEFRLGLVFQFF